MMKEYAALGAFLVGLAFWALISEPEVDHAQQEYCEMVQIWLIGGESGIPPEDRKGWPDFRGNYEEVCH